jgi:hypothetical protein
MERGGLATAFDDAASSAARSAFAGAAGRRFKIKLTTRRNAT